MNALVTRTRSMPSAYLWWLSSLMSHEAKVSDVSDRRRIRSYDAGPSCPTGGDLA